MWFRGGVASKNISDFPEQSNRSKMRGLLRLITLSIVHALEVDNVLFYYSSFNSQMHEFGLPS